MYPGSGGIPWLEINSVLNFYDPERLFPGHPGNTVLSPAQISVIKENSCCKRNTQMSGQIYTGVGIRSIAWATLVLSLSEFPAFPPPALYVHDIHKGNRISYSKFFISAVRILPRSILPAGIPLYQKRIAMKAMINSTGELRL